MKKTLFTLTSLVLIGALTVTGVYLQDRESLSDVALANIEALADGETEGGDVTCHFNISSHPSESDGGKIKVYVYCYDCKDINAYSAWGGGSCKR